LESRQNGLLGFANQSQGQVEFGFKIEMGVHGGKSRSHPSQTGMDSRCLAPHFA